MIFQLFTTIAIIVLKTIHQINCVVAIPENLLESELFGHTKVISTGAVTDKKGKFEIADGGTIFLDEIGEMDFKSSIKLSPFAGKRN